MCVFSVARTAAAATATLLLLPVVHAQTFRGSVGADVRDADLEAEYVRLGGDTAEVQQLQEALLPFWRALPKNEEGNLEHHSARYILHRLFVQRHGWYIKGLEPQGDVWSKKVRQATIKDWAPPSLLGALEGQAGSRGLTLTELAVLGAALKQQSHQENAKFMHDMYEVLLLDQDISNPAAKVQEVIWYYVARYLSGVVYTPKAALSRAAKYLAKYAEWDKTEAWYKAIEQEVLGDSSTVGIAAAVSVADNIGERYGAYNDVMCRHMKAALMGAWSKAKTTGRIRLADFYRIGLDTPQWKLDEKAEYLQALGALDDSNVTSPMVIIPNYLTARPNCLETTQLYAVCCRNECEDLLGHLEHMIAAPSAPPDQIAALVSNLASDTVAYTASPRELSPQMLTRLAEIADLHGGKVNLHGRMFAQWMHHMYPNECPFPQATETASFSSPDEWIGMEGASEEERRLVMEADACSPDEASEQWTVEVPWSEQEVLLSTEAQDRLQGSRRRSLAMLLLLIAALAAANMPQAAPLRRRLCTPAAKKYLSRPHALLACLLLIAIAGNLVNRAILLLSFCAVAISSCLSAAGVRTAKSSELCL